MKIAINVALIPSEEVVNKAIKINKKLVKEFKGSLILGRENCIPHITLIQCVIETSDVQKVEKILEEIANSFSPLSLKITEAHYRKTSTELPTSYFEIEKTPELQKLHELIMEKLSPFRCREIQKEFFYDKEQTRDSMVTYVKEFNVEHAFEKYRPHITLGKGKMEQVEPIEFTANKLILAHLGANGTCAKVLFATYLK